MIHQHHHQFCQTLAELATVTETAGNKLPLVKETQRVL